MTSFSKLIACFPVGCTFCFPSFVQVNDSADSVAGIFGFEANMHLRELRKNYWKHYSTFLQRDSLFAYASEIGAYAYSFFDELIQNDLLLYFTNNNFLTFVSTNTLHF